MAIQRARPPSACTAGLLALSVAVLVVVARAVAEPLGGTSYLVLLVMLGCTVLLLATNLRLDPGWIAWRRALVAFTFSAIAAPPARRPLPRRASSGSPRTVG